MFNGLGALTSIGTLTLVVSISGTLKSVVVPIYFNVDNRVLVSSYDPVTKAMLKTISGTVKYVVQVRALPMVKYEVLGDDNNWYQALGVPSTYSPDILTINQQYAPNSATIDFISAEYTNSLNLQKSWIATIKQTGFTHQAIINIDSKLASGIIATPSEIDSVRTVFINTSKTAPTQVGISVVIGVNEQNGLPYPILGVVAGVSPSGNYVAQVGTSYYEFVSGNWVSNTTDLEAKIADLQVKLNNAKAALAAAQARLNDLRSKAQALGITI